MMEYVAKFKEDSLENIYKSIIFKFQKPKKIDRAKLDYLSSFIYRQRISLEPLIEKKKNKIITKKEENKLRHLYLLIDEAEKKVKSLTKRTASLKFI